MEALNSKLYLKYMQLKTEKNEELENLNRNQEEKFLAFVTAADELIKQLKIENDRLVAEVDDLRSEVALVRSSRCDQIPEYEKLFMEENQKMDKFLQEIERLQSLLQEEELCCNARNDKNVMPNSPGSFQVGSDQVNNLGTRKRKHSKSGANTEAIETQCGDDELVPSALRDSADYVSKRSRFCQSAVVSNQEEKLRRCRFALEPEEEEPESGSGTTICMFQELVECLVGMKVSIVTEADETRISAVHQSTGYSFSLTCIKNSHVEGEWVYRVLSLGTMERIAPEWMKESSSSAPTCALSSLRECLVLTISLLGGTANTKWPSPC